MKAHRTEAAHEGQRGGEELKIAGSPYRFIVPTSMPLEIVRDRFSRATGEYSCGEDQLP